MFYLSGSYQLLVGEGRMTEAIQTMQDYFAEQGFEVDETRWSDDGAGRLRATDPDGFAYSARPIRPRDPSLAGRVRDATINAITGATTHADGGDYAQRAVALKAVLDQAKGLFTAGERGLLDELLDRLAARAREVASADHLDGEMPVRARGDRPGPDLQLPDGKQLRPLRGPPRFMENDLGTVW